MNLKNNLLCLALLFSSGLLSAQNISVAYFGNFLIQPGVKVGTEFTFKTWEASDSKKGLARSCSFFGRPQIGFYARSGNNINFLLNADLGYKRTKVDRQSYLAWSLGLGYLTQYQITSIAVNQGDGSIQKKRERRGYFLPTLNYEFGRAINSKITWYSKWAIGARLSPGQESSGQVFVELGLTFNWAATE